MSTFRDSHVVAFLRKVMVVRDASVLTHRRVPLSATKSKTPYDGVWTSIFYGLYNKWLTKTTTKFDQLDEFISQAEAARFRGVSKQAIANLIQRGRLTTVKIAGRTLLLRSEVEAFVPEPKLGRPPKKNIDKKKSKRVGARK